jgi:hypothetical protein
MSSLSLVSKYQIKRYKANKPLVNNQAVKNVLNREFPIGIKQTILVSDLTYIQVGIYWH